MLETYKYLEDIKALPQRYSPPGQSQHHLQRLHPITLTSHAWGILDQRVTAASD